MNVRSIMLLLIGILIGVGMQAVLAKGDAKVTITGGDLPQDIEISEDACVKNALSVGNINDPTMLVRTPPDVQGDGYLITHYDQLNTGDYQPFDSLRFYFDPKGGYGYVQYLGVDGYPSAMDGQWYRPTRQSEFVFEYLINRAHARLPLPQ